MVPPQGVEEMPQGGQGQIVGRVRSGQFPEEATDDTGRDLKQLDSLYFALSEEALHGRSVRSNLQFSPPPAMKGIEFLGSTQPPPNPKITIARA